MKKVLSLLVLVAVLSLQAHAANVVMTGNDTNSPTTSFNSDVQLKWSPAGAPVAGNTYSTVGYLLRTPSTAGSYSFAGDSLTVGGGNGGGANPFLTTGGVNNNALINKTPGTTTVITVNNLILDAGYIRDGQGSADIWAIAGNINVTANGGGFANQCRLNVDSVLSGSGNLYVADNGSGEAARQTYIRSALNTYNGTITLLGSSAARSRLTFSSGSSMNFVIGAAGVNNQITVGAGKFGTATFAGNFNFDLTGASTNFLDSWKIANVTSQTFSDTFTVNGFTSFGTDIWKSTVNGVVYKFTESTATLMVVPEPATMILLSLGSLALLRKKR